jgi:hypothetical protein
LVRRLLIRSGNGAFSLTAGRRRVFLSELRQ